MFRLNSMLLSEFAHALSLLFTHTQFYIVTIATRVTIYDNNQVARQWERLKWILIKGLFLTNPELYMK